MFWTDLSKKGFMQIDYTFEDKLDAMAVGLGMSENQIGSMMEYTHNAVITEWDDEGKRIERRGDLYTLHCWLTKKQAKKFAEFGVRSCIKKPMMEKVSSEKWQKEYEEH